MKIRSGIRLFMLIVATLWMGLVVEAVMPQDARPQIEIRKGIPVEFVVKFSKYEWSGTRGQKVGMQLTLQKNDMGSKMYPQFVRPVLNLGNNRRGVGGGNEMLTVEAPRYIFFNKVVLKLHGGGSSAIRRMYMYIPGAGARQRNVIFETKLEANKWVLQIRFN